MSKKRQSKKKEPNKKEWKKITLLIATLSIFLTLFIIGYGQQSNIIQKEENPPSPCDHLKEAPVAQIKGNSAILIQNKLVMSRTMSDSNSMLPVAGPGTTVYYVKPDSRLDICLGDMILFRSSEGVEIIHRVVKIEPSTFITKGDNNVYVDKDSVDYKEVIGVVIAVAYT